MSITFINHTVIAPPLKEIVVLTANSARMQIKFTRGVETVQLFQESASGEVRVFVWDRYALIELADALTQAASELEKEG